MDLEESGADSELISAVVCLPESLHYTEAELRNKTLTFVRNGWNIMSMIGET